MWSVTCTVSREETKDERQREQGTASGGRGRSEMDRHDANPGRSDPEAAADLPADDAGPDEQLRPTPEHPALLCLTATARRGATGCGKDLPSSLRAVDAAGATTAADLPG